MNELMIVLRIVHIFSGVFWVGTVFLNVGFLQPAARATGAEGQKFMQYLTGKTRLLAATYLAATLTVLSGLLMYGTLSQFRLSFLNSGYGLGLTIGGLAGIIAWLMAIVLIRGIFKQMQDTGKEIQAQGRPPGPEQVATMQALAGRLGTVGRIVLVWLVIALLGMSVAQYLN